MSDPQSSGGAATCETHGHIFGHHGRCLFCQVLREAVSGVSAESSSGGARPALETIRQEAEDTRRELHKSTLRWVGNIEDTIQLDVERELRVLEAFARQWYQRGQEDSRRVITDYLDGQLRNYRSLAKGGLITSEECSAIEIARNWCIRLGEHTP